MGTLKAPDASFNPATDDDLVFEFDHNNHVAGKKKNKRALQKTVGLNEADQAPLFFWPSRLDMVQKGCQLSAEIFYDVVSRYWKQSLEIVFVAKGVFQKHFKEIVQFHNLNRRVAICDADERLARLACGVSAVVVMPPRQGRRYQPLMQQGGCCKCLIVMTSDNCQTGTEKQDLFQAA